MEEELEDQMRSSSMTTSRSEVVNVSDSPPPDSPSPPMKKSRVFPNIGCPDSPDSHGTVSATTLKPDCPDSPDSVPRHSVAHDLDAIGKIVQRYT